MNIFNAVIGEPLATGSLHITETLSFTLVVVIVVGESGMNAHSNVKTLELAE